MVEFLGPVKLYPYGSVKTSMLVVGEVADVTVQLGWNADPEIKPGDVCYLYRLNDKGYFVSAEMLKPEEAKTHAEAMFEKAICHSTKKKAK